MFGTGPESECEAPLQTDYVYYSTEQQAFVPYELTLGCCRPLTWQSWSVKTAKAGLYRACRDRSGQSGNL